VAQIIKFPVKKRTPDTNLGFSERMEKIKASLAKIDQMMAELRKIQKKDSNHVDHSER
jgi:hypothetical protein